MRNKIIFVLVVLGIAGGIVSAYRLRGAQASRCRRSSTRRPTRFAQGIYANGIIESYQANGENTNIYPEVPGW